MKTLPSLTKPSPVSRDAVDGQQAGKSLETLADRLRSLGVRYAIVFGSVAANQASPDSDIDVAVLARGPLRTVDRDRFMTAIAESAGRCVDLIWQAVYLATGVILQKRCHSQKTPKVLPECRHVYRSSAVRTEAPHQHKLRTVPAIQAVGNT
jgi:predicted nucleotidyltransferase